MITLEQVEKLRQRANISYDEAKAALEETNGDMLEAIINLEKQNRINPPKGGGYYSSKNSQEDRKKGQHSETGESGTKADYGASFGELIGRFFRWCGKIVNRGNRNHFEIIKDGDKIMSIPVTVLAILLIFTFWITIPIIILGLFFGYRYMFSGPDLGKENVNRAMDSVADVAENLKKEVKGEKSNGENSDN
ncbi:Ubiquitin-associated-domain-containing protein [[Clostridium] ultunense Esp]|uniref:Ubiquitin-associated-domain-containing protein n=1 Tax=[Clostridium] ultunense Esp TaxID=1288971 RepID=M1ZFN0_9FIRM|nr:DUF4342 domain-containing protein [Schnuerera ultunensis]CCQ96968.1 Ubiquitin-associated-domain-containing protein [[Clostridium] ultunense Esp]SHD76476.1 Ubiquitin-associated-domain-containing protein [[Clostridium] ultunense Esp]